MDLPLAIGCRKEPLVTDGQDVLPTLDQPVPGRWPKIESAAGPSTLPAGDSTRNPKAPTGPRLPQAPSSPQMKAEFRREPLRAGLRPEPTAGGANLPGPILAANERTT